MVNELSDTQIADRLHEKVKHALEDIRRRFGGDRRKEFLWYWRMMETIHGERGFRGFVFSWLPADTRLPDHSIYDHLITASSLVIEDPTLVGINIGGVQSFIRQSRKVRDLWASSYLVSMISLAAMLVVTEELGPDSIIYPDIRKLPLFDFYLYMDGVLTEEELLYGRNALWSRENISRALLIPSIPGSFVFIAPYSSVREILRKIKTKIYRVFPRLGNDLSEILGINVKIKAGFPYPLSIRSYFVKLIDIESKSMEFLQLGENRQKIKEKLKELIPEEIYSSVEVNGNNLLDQLADLIILRNKAGGYKLGSTFLYHIAYMVLQAGISSQKLISHFESPEEPSIEGEIPIHRRCRLCGIRNPLIHGGGRNEKESWRNLVKELRSSPSTAWAGWQLDEEEPLCPVCLIKRLLRSFFRTKEGYDSLLLSLWAVVLDRSKEELRQAIKLLESSLVNSARSIYTLDDVATFPIKEEIAEHIGKEQVKDTWEAIVDLIGKGVAISAEVYRKARDLPEDSAARRYSSFILSELGRSWPEILERIRGDQFREELIYQLMEIKIDEASRDPFKLPGSYLYASTWENLMRSLEEVGLGNRSRDLKNLIEKLDYFYREVLEMEPSNYIALILSDGDRMGDWVSGRKLFESNVVLANRVHPSILKSGNSKEDITAHYSKVIRPMTPSLHRTISRILRNLAQDVYPIIVRSLGGFTFYSGGDDLLAVVPAIQASTLLESVHSCFSSEIIGLPDGKVVMSMGRLATISSGLVVAHRLIPMSDLLEKLREEEKVAKGEMESCSEGRDRSSIVRMSRSLSESRAMLPGRLIRVSEEPKLGEAVRLLFNLMKGEKSSLSKSFLRDMLLALEIFGKAYNSPSDNWDYLSGLIERTVERNLRIKAEQGREKIKREIIDLYLRIAQMDSHRLNEAEKFEEHPLVNFQRALLTFSKEVI